MKEKESCYIALPGLSGVTHGFSTRIMGVSKGPFESLNLGFHTGDSQANVLENYRILLQQLGVSFESLVLSGQIHEDKIYVATGKDRGRGLPGGKPSIQGYDALITDDPSLCLVIFTADCVPLLFYDGKRQVVGAAHAGWRGTALEIGRKTVEKMRDTYGCSPGDMIAGIGPSIGPCCYQIDAPVAAAFRKYPRYITPDGEAHYKLNLQAINKQILTDAGLLEENIFLSGYCTMCRRDLFYSHRVLGPKRGSLASLIQLKRR